MAACDRIIIEGLKVNAIIGIYPHEREFAQPLVLDIIMEHDLRPCATSGDLNLSINYAQVAEEVSALVCALKCELLETLAEQVCQFILQNFKPRAVTLKIVKTQAVLNTSGVGVQIRRTQQDFQED